MQLNHLSVKGTHKEPVRVECTEQLRKSDPQCVCVCVCVPAYVTPVAVRQQCVLWLPVSQGTLWCWCVQTQCTAAAVFLAARGRWCHTLSDVHPQPGEIWP